jgi:hypothetical protein
MRNHVQRWQVVLWSAFAWLTHACGGEGPHGFDLGARSAGSAGGPSASSGGQRGQSPAVGGGGYAGLPYATGGTEFTPAGTGGLPPQPAGAGSATPAAGGQGGASSIGLAGSSPAKAGTPGAASTGDSGGTGAGGTAAGGTAAAGSPPLSVDGDPSRPIVEVANIPCGPHPSLAGLTATNATIGGRDVHVAYPCGKHEGAPVTFVLNLHGTMPTEELKLYQVAYFSINTLVDSHNIVTVAPKSVVSQWGNGDNGADEPHLMQVIDWVYTTFAKFDIRGMWVGGHSWGALYTSTFACKAELADKVKGTILMSGPDQPPSCADRLAVIGSVAENDIVGPMDQGTLPTQHGCSAAEMLTLGNNEQTWWADCRPGFVHSNYFMLGKAHADYMDAEVVKSIADLIVASRL